MLFYVKAYPLKQKRGILISWIVVGFVRPHTQWSMEILDMCKYVVRQLLCLVLLKFSRSTRSVLRQALAMGARVNLMVLIIIGSGKRGR